MHTMEREEKVMMRLIGISEDITICFHCGKRNLKKTVAIQHETGEVNYYGTECAANILSIGTKGLLKTAEKTSKNDTFLFSKKDK